MKDCYSILWGKSKGDPWGDQAGLSATDHERPWSDPGEVPSASGGRERDFQARRQDCKASSGQRPGYGKQNILWFQGSVDGQDAFFTRNGGVAFFSSREKSVAKVEETE